MEPQERNFFKPDQVNIIEQEVARLSNEHPELAQTLQDDLKKLKDIFNANDEDQNLGNDALEQELLSKYPFELVDSSSYNFSTIANFRYRVAASYGKLFEAMINDLLDNSIRPDTNILPADPIYQKEGMRIIDMWSKIFDALSYEEGKPHDSSMIITDLSLRTPLDLLFELVPGSEKRMVLTIFIGDFEKVTRRFMRITQKNLNNFN